MRNVISMLEIILLSLLTACSDDEMKIGGDAAEIAVVASCFQDRVNSRTSMTGSKAAFTTNDKIGIYEVLSGRNNVPFTFNGSLWTTTTPLYWLNGSSVHTFYGYYPYNALGGSGLSVPLPVLTGQNVSSVPDPVCDMLVTPSAKTQARGSGASVVLTMNHAFALLRFDIKMGLLSLINPYRLDSIIVRGGNSGGSNPYGMFNTVNDVSKVNYSFSSGAITLLKNDATTCSQYLRKAPQTTVNILNTFVSVYVLILPGAYTNPVPAVQLNLSTLSILPKNTGYLRLPNASSFVAGNMYVYQVTVGLNLTRSRDGEMVVDGGKIPAQIQLCSQ